MVERPSTSAMRRNMYIPEDRPGYAEYIADPENQQKAQDAALNLAALLSGPIGEIPAGLRLARQVLGGSKLLERGQQYLARPDGGNARLPEEMLQPTLPAPPAQQAVPPFRSPGQLGYSPTTRPTRDDRMGRIEGEGGFDPQAIAQAQRARTERERGEQRQDISRLEGEGGTTADTVQMARDVHNRRVAQERAQREMELSRFEGEGGREGRSFSRDFTFEGPSYYNYPPPVRFNEAGVPVAGGRPVTNDMPLFTQGEHGIPSLSYSPKNSGAMMERPASDMVPPPRLVGSQKAGESTGPFFGAGSSNSYGRNQYMDDIAEVSTALRPSIVGTTQIINSPAGNYRPETPTSNAPANTAGGYEFQFRAPTITPADLFDMRGNHPLPPPRPAGLVATGRRYQNS